MVAFILDHPQMGENIGATARAMLNFGITELRLVSPRDGWPNERAEAMAAGALGIMPPVNIYENLQDALADMHFVLATTARVRDMNKPIYNPKNAAKEGLSREIEGQKVGFLFGAERAGLLNDDVVRAHGIVTIPTNKDFPALNLAQSVLLLAYEWSLQAGFGENKIENEIKEIASHQELEYFLKRLECLLEESGQFFRSHELMPTMKRNIRNIFMRHQLSQQDVRTLQGVLSALTSMNLGK